MVGQLSQAGSVLFTIARDQRLDMVAQIPEFYLSALAPGDTVQVLGLDGTDRVGEVRTVGQSVDEQTRMAEVSIALPLDQSLRKGQFGRVIFAIDLPQSLTVDANAVVWREGKPGVFTLDPAGVTAFVALELGLRAKGRVTVSGDLVAGDKVAVAGAGFLNPGDKVAFGPAGRADGSAGMNRISAWSINNPVPTVVLFLVLTLAGLYGFGQLRINSNPDIDAPAVIVSVSLAGASASELETQVTQLVESAVNGIAGLDEITSTISEGASTTTISFAFGTDISQASDDVRNALTAIQSQLPASASTPTVEQLDISGGAVVTFVIAAPSISPDALSWYVDNELASALNAVTGVATIERSGRCSATNSGGARQRSPGGARPYCRRCKPGAGQRQCR